MKKANQLITLLCLFLFLNRMTAQTIFLMGDSTMADYADNYEPGKSYLNTRYPITGWGQVFRPYTQKDSIKKLKGFLKRNKKHHLVNLARGGRSTRTFFQEGRWRKVYENLQKNDLVLIQFGHNDAAETKTERYVPLKGFKEFLRFYSELIKSKGAIPVLLTPVARNYPWRDGVLEDVHGDYDKAVKEVALETNTLLLDLNKRSREFFTKEGKEKSSTAYFMNFSAGVYEAYPEGSNDNTHFQTKGAEAVAQLVFDGLKDLANEL